MGGTHQKENLLDGAGGKGAAELNYGTRNEHKEIRDGRAGDGRGLSEEDESRINEAALDVKESHVLEAAVVTHNPVLEKQQPQILAPVVQWERFLPLRTIKVLLVENDDSTRQVVSALLRNCCYEVTGVANVLEAWRVLEDLTNRIDLVLTEVVMPSFSGLGLLCKIMSHKTCKTIPVIMMSSNDSMGIVFKCLSKGAVDFLVKPIRKNELKNLWQHVWRRCHSYSGSRSGSESGIQCQKNTKSDNEHISDNNTDSVEEDNDSIGWNARDESDNGSGTQSSWREHAIEVDSPQSMSPSKQIAVPQDSTWAQVVHPTPETFSKKMTLNSCTDSKEHKKAAEYGIMGKDLETGLLRSTYIRDEQIADSKEHKKAAEYGIMGKDLETGGLLRSTYIRDESYQTDKIPTKLTCPSTDNSPENGARRVNHNVLHDPNSQSADQLGGDTNQQLEFTLTDTTFKAYSKISENKEEYMELSSFELSLKRLRSTGEVGMPSSDGRLSNLSAFSRYPVSVASVQAHACCGGSFLLNNSEAVLLNQISNGSSENNDMGSTNKKCNRSASAFHPVQPRNFTLQLTEHDKIDEVATFLATGQPRGLPKQVQVQQHPRHYHHHHALHAEPDQDDSSLENLKTTAGNYSLNGSNSCSNHGSDGQNGCLGGTNMEKGGDGNGGSGSGGGGGGADLDRFAQREAALNKFRQKRKARNFSKMVRYQSRKRLAEQRPRFRGQFVRGGSIICSENHEADS